MDKTTQSVRDMYERYPYPAGAPQIRAAADARLLLSYVERSRSSSGVINVLDAGCGRGLGILGSALVQPDVNFLGVVMNRVALKEAATQAREQGLTNVRFKECDLMTLDRLDAPEGGFDVIYSLGVIHHMSDPVGGLRKLREVLAPHGVVSFMVYAKQGRLPLKSVTNAINLLFTEDAPIAERVVIGRALAALAKDGILSNTFWESTSDVNDVEFVDRCLNVNETSYDVASLWGLISNARMRFIRWIEPDQWSVCKIFPEGELRDRASQIDEVDQYKLIEHICWHSSFEMILSRDNNTSRRPLSEAELAERFFAVSPDVSFIYEKRNLRGSQRLESLSYKLRHREAVSVSKGPLATGILALENQMAPFRCDAWTRAMAQENIAQDVARALLLDLVNREILFCPHNSDV